MRRSSEPFNNMYGGGIYDQVLLREEEEEERRRHTIRNNNVVPLPPLNYYYPYYGALAAGQIHNVYNMHHYINSNPNPYLVPPPNFIPIPPWTHPYPHPSYNHLYHHHPPPPPPPPLSYNFNHHHHHNPPFVHQLPAAGVFNLVGAPPSVGYHDYTANSHYFKPPPPPLTTSTSTSTYDDHHEKNPPSCSTSYDNDDDDNDCGSDNDSYYNSDHSETMFHDYESDFIDLSEHAQREEVNYLGEEMFEKIRRRGQFDPLMIVGHDIQCTNSNIYGKHLSKYEVKADGYYRKGEAGGCGAILLDATTSKPIVAVARTSKEAVSVLYHHLQGIEEGVKLALSRGCHEVQVFTSSEYAYRVVEGDITPMLKDKTLDVYKILCRVRWSLSKLSHDYIDHMPRERMRAADYLAKLSRDVDEILPCDFDNELRGILDEDEEFHRQMKEEEESRMEEAVLALETGALDASTVYGQVILAWKKQRDSGLIDW